MKDGAWPAWVAAEPGILSLFEIMKPFQEDDVGKAWGIESRLKPVDFFFAVMCH